MKKYFLLITASFLAFEACLILASSSTLAMEEAEEANRKNSQAQRALESPLNKGERLYTLSRRSNEPYPYVRASDVFKEKLWFGNGGYGVVPSSLEELEELKQSGLAGSLILQENFQYILRASMEDAMVHHSGNVYSEIPKKELEKDLLIYLSATNFKKLTPLARMLSLTGMVKSGCVEGVKSLTQMLLEINREELFNYNKILHEKDPSYNDVPIFWLPAIVTRWDEENVPDKNYREIEEYLCEILCPTGEATVNGQTFTREGFVMATNEWKVKENNELKFDRHQLPLSFVLSLNN